MLKPVLISFFLLLLFPAVANAQVVINEVLPNPSGSSSELNEFVELYNAGSESVTITGWTISDTLGSTDTFVIPEKILVSGEYVFYRKETTGISLNNDGDGVVLKDNLNNVKNEMSFGSTIEDRSWSRIPNGSGDFVNDTQPTEGSANSAPPSTPTPSPTATPTSTSTPTPTPTPVKTPTPKPTVKAKATSKPTPVPEEESNNESLLGARDELNTPTPEPEEKSKSKFPLVAGVMILGGAAFLGVASYPLLKQKLKGYNKVSDESSKIS